MALTECDCQPVGIEIDLQALRKRFSGSRMWLEILVVTYATLPPVGDWTRLLAVAEELIACATSMRAHAALFSGITARAHCQFALGDSVGALQSHQACYQLASETGWKNAMAVARLDAAGVHLHLIDPDGAAVCIDEASAHLSHGAYVSVMVRIPLLRAMVLALRGELDGAVRELLSVSPDRIEQVSEDALCEWAEVGGLLAMRLGHAALADKIVTGLREMDADHDETPAVRSFRNQLFGPPDAVGSRSATELNQTRLNLRRWLKELHQCLA